MFKFLRALMGESSVAKSNDNVVFDQQTKYLHFDVTEDGVVKRYTVCAPGSAAATSYDNTASTSTSVTVQEAIDELYRLVKAAVVSIEPDDENESMIIHGAQANDAFESVTLSLVKADSDESMDT